MKLEKEHVIKQLHALGVYADSENKSLDEMEYRELTYLLAAKLAVLE